MPVTESNYRFKDIRFEITIDEKANRLSLFLIVFLVMDGFGAAKPLTLHIKDKESVNKDIYIVISPKCMSVILLDLLLKLCANVVKHLGRELFATHQIIKRTFSTFSTEGTLFLKVKFAW